MSAANEFMLLSVQEWGQTEDERIAAFQAVLDEAGFDAKANCAPIFGAFLQQEPICDGPDVAEADVWARAMLDTMPRGEFNAEVQHIQDAIDHAKADREQTP